MSNDPPGSHRQDRADTPQVSVESLLVFQHAGWKQGSMPDVESLIQRVPGGALSGDEILDLIYSELILRSRWGEVPQLADYQKRFPAYAEQIQELFDEQQQLKAALPSESSLATSLQRRQSFSGSLKGLADSIESSGKVESPTSSGPAFCVKLKVTAGPQMGKEFSFRKHDNFIVGRGLQAHFRLSNDDRYFSRVHFLVEVHPPKCRLLDLGSRNGTKVNGQRVQSADLQDGDVIGAGRTQIQVLVESAGPLPSKGISANDSALLNNSPAIASGIEVLPLAVEMAINTPIADPHGLLPADYLERVSKHPQPIEGYRLIRELGRGGMGTVYLAIRESDQSIMAVKTIRPGTLGFGNEQKRFLRETEILQKLLHPHIVGFRENGRCRNLLYFAMEYVNGCSADTLIRQHSGKMPVARAVNIILQLLTALRYAHAEGYVHRDIKPANLLVSEGKNGDFVKLADFGLARIYQASGLSGLTMTGELGGTIGYISPEQITDFSDSQPATDQYAAAASLYHMLTGSFIYDFPNDRGKMIFTILETDPVPIRQRRPEIPECLATAIHRALARNPDARFPDVRGFHAALAPFSASS